MSDLGIYSVTEGVNITMEEAMPLLISDMVGEIAGAAEELPESGDFEKTSVYMIYHGTEYAGVLQYTDDAKMQTYIWDEETGTLEPDPESEPVHDHIRHIKTGVIYTEDGAGTLHDFFGGTKEECLQWLQKKENIQVLVDEYLYLKDYLEQQIKERQKEMEDVE